MTLPSMRSTIDTEYLLNHDAIACAQREIRQYLQDKQKHIEYNQNIQKINTMTNPTMRLDGDEIMLLAQLDKLLGNLHECRDILNHMSSLLEPE